VIRSHTLVSISRDPALGGLAGDAQIFVLVEHGVEQIFRVFAGLKNADGAVVDVAVAVEADDTCKVSTWPVWIASRTAERVTGAPDSATRLIASSATSIAS
jgi:hypothetical protein